MFDIGWDELFLIALVALVVIGPKDLPGVLRVLGVWIARARNLAGEFRSHVDEMIREANVDEMKREFSAMAAPPELKEMEDNLMLGNPLSPSEPKTPEPEAEAPAETAPEK
jgi:sec-independent protein translocase protein TatB